MSDKPTINQLHNRVINISDECWTDIAKYGDEIAAYIEDAGRKDESQIDELKFRMAVTILAELSLRKADRMEQDS